VNEADGRVISKAISGGEARKNSLLHDLAAEGEDAGFAFGVFGFRDLAVLDVHLGEGGPGEEVVGAEGGGHQAGADGFLELVEFHEDHAEGVPAVEEGGVEFDAAPQEGHGVFEIADGDAAAGVVEEVLDFR
jgi:hypothetical protein